MSDTAIVAIVVGVLVGFAVIALLAVSFRGIGDLLRAVATSAGWTNIQKLFFAASGVRGVWRQFPVELAYHARQKGAPQRLVMKLTARSDAQLIVKRKFNGLISNKPLTWFGPPLIDVHHPSASNLWVRGDAMTAGRLFSDPTLASLIDRNLVARYDEVKLNDKGVKITRALDERPVKQKYGFPTFTITSEPERYEPIAREEIALAEALANKLASA